MHTDCWLLSPATLAELNWRRWLPCCRREGQLCEWRKSARVLSPPNSTQMPIDGEFVRPNSAGSLVELTASRATPAAPSGPVWKFKRAKAGRADVAAASNVLLMRCEPSGQSGFDDDDEGNAD